MINLSWVPFWSVSKMLRLIGYVSEMDVIRSSIFVPFTFTSRFHILWFRFILRLVILIWFKSSTISHRPYVWIILLYVFNFTIVNPRARVNIYVHMQNPNQQIIHKQNIFCYGSILTWLFMPKYSPGKAIVIILLLLFTKNNKLSNLLKDVLYLTFDTRDVL